MRLLLLRHAKSSWDAGQKSDDHDRPLNRWGREAAPVMGSYMRDSGLIPDIVLCSTALRTTETLERVLPYFKLAPEIRRTRGLYLADWPALLKLIRELPPSRKTALLVGHNPGIERLAMALAFHPKTIAERARAERLAEKFPTAGLAALEFSGSTWAAVKAGEGRLLDYVRPKDLQSDDLYPDDESWA